MREALFSRRSLLQAGGALIAGAAVAGPVLASAAQVRATTSNSTSLTDPVLPGVSHRIIETNGIHLHVAEQGEGPLVVLCHGFPECWYSWRHQLGMLAWAGFHAVAFDLRGYGRSDRPGGDEVYTIL